MAFDDDKLKAAILGNLEQWFEGYMYNLKEMFVKQDEKGSNLMVELEKLIKELGANSINLFTSKGDLKNKSLLEEEMVMLYKNF